MPRTSEIAARIGAELRGADLASVEPTSLGGAREGAIVFLSSDDATVLTRLNALQGVACITTNALAEKLQGTILVHEEPKIAFCLLLHHFYESKPPVTLAAAAVVSPQADIGGDVDIGPGAVIGKDVSVGPGTRIGCNVVVAPGCRIGSDCVIKSNTTIGEAGFGFVRSLDKRLVRFPHIGSVCIGDRVEIGSNCTVVRAALDTTVVGDDVKTDDHVHIAHNVVIGAGCLLAAGVILSGSICMGEDVWVGPNAVIADHVQIGSRAWISLGSVVSRDVPDDGRVFGNPARLMPGSKQT